MAAVINLFDKAMEKVIADAERRMPLVVDDEPEETAPVIEQLDLSEAIADLCDQCRREVRKDLDHEKSEAMFNRIMAQIDREEREHLDTGRKLDKLVEAQLVFQMLVLSRLEGTIRNMGPEAGEALDKYVAAVREAQA